MKIAVNTRFLLKGKLEGVGIFTYEILRRLVERHPEHEFIFFFDRPFDTSFVFAKNVTPVVLSPPARHPLLFIIWFEISVVRALRRYQADLFLSLDNFCALRATTPTLLVVHDIFYKHHPQQIPRIPRLYYQFFMPRFLKRADALVTVSEFVKHDIEQSFQLHPAPKTFEVVHNAASDQFKPLQPTEIQRVRAIYSNHEPYFLYVGAVHPRKNVHRLIQAFDQFKTQTQSTARLLIAGRFAWKIGEVTSAYEAAQHRADIVFLGYVPDENLPELYGGAFAFTYVSTFEGFGIPILEAMQCDVPVLTSMATAMPEVAGDAAHYADPFSVSSIAEGLKCLWENVAYRAALVEKGRRRRQMFSWERSAEKLWSIIETNFQRPV